MIEKEQEFRDRCKDSGLKDKTIKNYISWLNMASLRINEDIKPSSLSSEADIARMLSLLSQHPDMLRIHGRRIQDTKAAMRKYVSMCCKNGNTIEIIRPYFVDQFSIQEKETPEVKHRERTGTVVVRNPEMKQRALDRARGKCEYCGVDGFPTINGQIYLESHHIIPLSEDGPDIHSNIAALCPNHHRQAHHGIDRNVIRETLQKKLLQSLLQS